MYYSLKKIVRSAVLVTFFCTISQNVSAQYPDIPEALQAKTDSVLAKEEKRLQTIWESNYHIIKEESKT